VLVYLVAVRLAIGEEEEEDEEGGTKKCRQAAGFLTLNEVERRMRSAR